MKRYCLRGPQTLCNRFLDRTSTFLPATLEMRYRRLERFQGVSRKSTVALLTDWASSGIYKWKKLLLLCRGFSATVGCRGKGWKNRGNVWVLACEYPHGRVAISTVFPREDLYRWTNSSSYNQSVSDMKNKTLN